MSDALPPIGALLFSSPPTLSDEEANALAACHFGKSGQLKRLTSERDLNFQLTDASGDSFVLKLANPAEQAEVTNFQTAALLHLTEHDPALPVPRVIRTRDGATEVTLPEGTLRMLTYLEGEPMHRAQRSVALRRATAAMGAKLAQGLREFHHSAAAHDLLWDIKQAARLRGLLSSIADPVLEKLALRCLDRFDAAVAGPLHSVRWQVVHNDLNPHNVLVDPRDPAKIAGVLDFGDMVYTPLICDVAVAASYQIDVNDPMTSLVDFAAAWHQVNPLLPAELDLLFDLVATRMVTTIAITSWRAAQYPENAAYILRNFPSAQTGLESFANLNRDDVRRALDAACP